MTNTHHPHTPPRILYLQISDGFELCGSDLDWTHCADHIYEDDVEYIRKDIVDDLVAACEAFIEACGAAGSYDDIEASLDQARAALQKARGGE